MGHLIGVLIGKLLKLVGFIILMPFYLLGQICGTIVGLYKVSDMESVIVDSVKEGRVKSFSKFVSYESATKYAVKNGAKLSGYENDPDDDLLTFEKIIDGVEYHITILRGREDGTQIEVRTPSQHEEYRIEVLGGKDSELGKIFLKDYK